MEATSTRFLKEVNTVILSQSQYVKDSLRSIMQVHQCTTPSTE